MRCTPASAAASAKDSAAARSVSSKEEPEPIEWTR